MQALVFTRVSTVELLEVDEPVAADGEVLVEVRASAICGSELHGVRSVGFRTPPLIMGHEFAGNVGSRRVAVNPLIACGACDMCGRSAPELCRNRQILGIHRPGGFAQLVAVPATQLVDLPEGVGWTEAALIEPLANALHAWGLAAGVQPRRVGIIGAGTIGLMCLIAGRRLSPEAELVAADLSAERLEVARHLGAGATAPQLEDEFDLVFDCVGAPATRAASVARLRPGGLAVWIGLAVDSATFPGNDLVRLEKRVAGSFAYSPDEFRRAAQMAAGVDLGWQRSFPLSDGATVFTELMNGRTDVTKAVLRP